MGFKNWWNNLDGKRSNGGDSSTWCMYGGKHSKAWGRGDSIKDRWVCAKCDYMWGRTGVFDYGTIKKGEMDG